MAIFWLNRRSRRFIMSVLAGSLAGLAVAASASAASPGRPDEFFPPSGNEPIAITVGPDGNLWFTEGEAIGRITPTGDITEFPSAKLSYSTQGIAAGSDGNLWFTERSRIARATPSGSISEFSVPDGFKPAAIVAGPDGNLWFTDSSGSSQMGRITPSGEVTIFSGPEGRLPEQLTAGPDGAVWFAEHNAPQGSSVRSASVGRISPGGEITEYSVGAGLRPTWGIALGPEGDMWFNVEGRSLGRITPDGASVSRLPLLSPSDLFVQQAAAGPDGNIWFAGHWGSHPGFPNVVRVTPEGRDTVFGITNGGRVASIATGPDGNIWFTVGPQVYPAESGGRYIGRITTAQLPGTPEIPGDEAVAWRRGLTSTITCAGDSANSGCAGQVQFNIELRRRSSPHVSTSFQLIAGGRYEMSVGESQTLNLRLTRAAKRMLAKHSRLNAYAVFKASNAPEYDLTTGQLLVLRRHGSRPKRHRHHTHHHHRR